MDVRKIRLTLELRESGIFNTKVLSAIEKIPREIFIPENFISSNDLKKSGKAGVFAGSLELAKEGNIKIKQDKLFDSIYIKET